MSAGTKNDVRSVAFNLPNQLTWARLLLAVVLFCVIPLRLYLLSLVLFVVAAATDWLDGYFARKYGLVTTLGRILDPFVDKVIVCGTFIYLASIEHSGIHAWMAVIVVGRELLITALRSFLEQQGADFSAALSGKLKMVLQCIAAGLSLYYLYLSPSDGAIGPNWLATLVAVAAWAAVAMTVISGIAYVRTAIGLFRQ